MKLAGESRIEAFAIRYKNVESALKRWIQTVEAAEWKNPAEMKRTFRSADIVGSQTVFNVGGNKCRLIALVQYGSSRVLVQRVLTHAEYDKGDWRE